MDKKGLIEKINAAALDVGGKLKADKRNTQQDYAYISADKSLSVLGQALFSAGVAVIPNVTESTMITAEYTDAYGKPKRRYDAEVSFLMLLTDGESDLTLTWRGMGSDFSSPDKALYKAITSGHKYFLLKLMCIGEGNEDSEHEAPEKPTTTAKPPAPAKPAGNGRKPEPATEAEFTPAEPPWMAEAGRELGGVEKPSPARAKMLARLSEVEAQAAELGIVLNVVDISGLTDAQVIERGKAIRAMIDAQAQPA